MAIQKTGNANCTGPNASGEYFDVACILTLANNATCAQGQVLCVDVTAKVGRSPVESANSGLADQVVLPSAASAGPIFGVYQGAAFTNSTGATQTYIIEARQEGAGVVSAESKTAGAAVNVGSALILNGTDAFPIAGTAALGVKVGTATATGAVTAKGSAIIAIPGSGTTVAVINAYIQIA